MLHLFHNKQESFFTSQIPRHSVLKQFMSCVAAWQIIYKGWWILIVKVIVSGTRMPGSKSFCHSFTVELGAS